MAAADAVVLVTMRPDIALAGDLADPHRWLSRVGADGAAAALCGAALWLLAAWFAVGLLAALAAGLPGAFGRMLRATARVMLPRACMRLVAGAAGVGIALAPAAAGAAPTGSGSPAGAPASVAVPAPRWPSDGALPAPAWPSTSTPHHRPDQQSPPPGGQPAPHQSSTGPHPASHRDHRAATSPAQPHDPRGGSPGTVVVRPGDSLWTIAAGRLGTPHGAHPPARRIAATWPLWYAANRALIGDDPNLITPGQILHPPTNGDPA